MGKGNDLVHGVTIDNRNREWIENNYFTIIFVDWLNNNFFTCKY